MHLGILTDPARPLADEIDWTAGNEFRLIDIHMAPPGAGLETTKWAEIGRTIAGRGLTPICYAPAYLVVENPSPLIRQAALNELRRCIDAAEAAGAHVLTMRFRGWPRHLSEKEGYEYCRQLYGILVEHGEERGVAVALENSAVNAHQLKYFREIFHRVPGLRLHLNIGNGNVDTAESMTRHYLFALADRLAHVHLSDNDGRSATHLPLGAPAQGGINLLRELQSLRSFNYDGGISLDIRGDRRWTAASADRVRELWPAAA